MPAPWSNLKGFAKVTAILATILSVSLGLCGLNWAGSAVAFRIPSLAQVLAGPLLILAYVEAAAIVLSFVGLVAVSLAWFFTIVWKSLFRPGPPPPPSFSDPEPKPPSPNDHTPPTPDEDQP